MARWWNQTKREFCPIVSPKVVDMPGEGFEGLVFVAGKNFKYDKFWMVAEQSTGYSVVTLAATRKEAIALAQRKLAKEGAERVRGHIARILKGRESEVAP